ncbi:MAG: tetratricopeptide repeat protein [Verrucomicrobia bacterium]|nr:tetratricopeptide repeat protein [Cytophagales bacterium]
MNMRLFVYLVAISIFAWQASAQPSQLVFKQILRQADSPSKIQQLLSLSLQYPDYQADSVYLCIEKASLTATRLNDNKNLLDCWNHWANFYVNIRKDTLQADIFIKKVLENTAIQKNIEAECTAWYNYGQLACLQSYYSKAFAYYEKALTISLLNNSFIYAKVMIGIANCQANLGQYTKAKASYLSAYQFSQKNNDTYCQGISLIKMGLLTKRQGEYTQSLDYFGQSSLIWEQRKDKKRYSDCLIAMADIYWATGNHIQYMDMGVKALTIKEQIGDRSGMAMSLNGIGHYYQIQKDYPKAIENFQKAVNTAKSVADERWVAYSLANMADVYRIQKNYPEALRLHTEALSLREKLQNKHETGLSYNDIGFTYSSSGEFDKALWYFKKALVIFYAVSAKPNLSVTNLSVAEIFINKKMPDSAVVYIDKGLFFARSVQLKYSERRAFLLFSQLYDLKNDAPTSLAYYRKFVALKDSLFSTETSKQIAELQTRYETEKKEARIEVLNKENLLNAVKLEEKTLLAEQKRIELALLLKEDELEKTTFAREKAEKQAEIQQVEQEKILQNLTFRQQERDLRQKNIIQQTILENQQLTFRNWLLFGLICFILVGTISIVLFLRQRQKLRLETEKRLRENIISQFESLKNQINPHFLLNSLNNLSVLIGTNPDKARVFTQEFAKVYRYVLELKDNLLVSLEEELTMCRAFVTMQQLRFGENLQVNFKISEENRLATLPPLSLQLLIENAIKHNEISDEKPLKIDISVENDYLLVKNNFQDKIHKEVSTQIGLKNLKERYHLASEKQPVFIKDTDEYIAKIPLLEV